MNNNVVFINFGFNIKYHVRCLSQAGCVEKRTSKTINNVTCHNYKLKYEV